MKMVCDAQIALKRFLPLIQHHLVVLLFKSCGDIRKISSFTYRVVQFAQSCFDQRAEPLDLFSNMQSVRYNTSRFVTMPPTPSVQGSKPKTHQVVAHQPNIACTNLRLWMEWSGQISFIILMRSATNHAAGHRTYYSIWDVIYAKTTHSIHIQFHQ